MTASLLSVHALSAFYGDFQALFGVDFRLEAGETVAIIGANGAGKSTFLRSLVGLAPAPPPRDSILLDGAPIGGLPAHQLVGLGLAMAPEGRRLFPSLSVEENLKIGAYSRRPGPWTLSRIYELFPALAARRRSPATVLSGGQQQMVAIGRALMANPRVLLCDEISLGLAPVVVKDIYQILPVIKAEGAAVVLVEQDVGLALKMSDRVYCFQEGAVSLEGRPGDLTHDRISAAYFGV